MNPPPQITYNNLEVCRNGATLYCLARDYFDKVGPLFTKRYKNIHREISHLDKDRETDVVAILTKERGTKLSIVYLPLNISLKAFILYTNPAFYEQYVTLKTPFLFLRIL